MTRIETPSVKLSKRIQKNSELMPYFEAINTLPEALRPQNKFEAALYYLAIFLGYNKKSAKIEDLKGFFSSKNEETNGIYFYGSVWKIYQAGPLNDIEIGNITTASKASAEKLYKAIISQLSKKDVKEKMFPIISLSIDECKKFSAEKATATLKIVEIAAKAHDLIEKEKKTERGFIIKEALKQTKKAFSDRIKYLQKTKLDLTKLQIKFNTIPARILHNKSLFMLWYVLVTKFDSARKKTVTDIFKDESKTTTEILKYIREKHFNKATPNYWGKDFFGKNGYLEWSQKKRCWRYKKNGYSSSTHSIGLFDNLISFIEKKNPTLIYHANNAFNKVHESISSDSLEVNKELANKIDISLEWTNIEASDIPSVHPFNKSSNQNWRFFRLGENTIVGHSQNGSDFASYNGRTWLSISEKQFNNYLKDRSNKDFINETLKPETISDDKMSFIYDLNNDNEVIGWDPSSKKDKTKKLTNEKKLRLIHLLKCVEIKKNQEKFTNIPNKTTAISELKDNIKKLYIKNLQKYPLIPLAKKVENLSELAASEILKKFKDTINLDKDSEKVYYYHIELAADGKGTLKITKTENKEKPAPSKKRNENNENNQQNNKSNSQKSWENTAKNTWNKVSPEFKKAGKQLKYIWEGAFEGGKGLWYEKIYNISRKSLIATGRTLKYLTIGAAPSIVKASFLTGVAGIALLWRKVKRQRKAGKKTDMINEASKTLSQGTQKIGRFAKFASKYLKNTRALKFLAGVPIIGALFAGAITKKPSLPKTNKSTPKKGEKIRYPFSRKFSTLKKNTQLSSRAMLSKKFTIPKGYKLVLPKYTPRNIASRLISRFRKKGRPVPFYIPFGKKINNKSAQSWMEAYYEDGDQIEFKEGSILPANTILPTGTKLIKK